jgi:colicin import membrane protein
MPSAHDRIAFGPPRDEGSVRAFALALLVHALLIVALAWGINWQRTDQSVGYEAEIWSAAPQMVAPRLIEAQPTPPPAPPSPPQPELKAPPAKVTPPAPDVDIALEQEKKRRLLVAQKEAEAKVLAERQRALEVAEKAKQKELRAREDQAKRLAAEEAQKAQAQTDAQKQARELAKAQDAEKQAQAALQKQREDNLNRIKGLAGASGGANDTGSALRATGPSASYAGKLNAAIRPNVVFSGEITGNPVTKVEVRVMSDGTVISQRVIKPSGNKNWDDAAINAIIRTRVLPRDVDGRMPDMIFIFDMKPHG